MRKLKTFRLFSLIILLAVSVMVGSYFASAQAQAVCEVSKDPLCYQSSANTYIQKLEVVTKPRVAVPDWLE
jgi:hypothetical protein